MKKISVALLALFVCVGLFAQENKGVNFENLTFDQALAKAKNNKKGPKLVFLDCYTTWCGPCKHMADVVFPQEAAGKYFNAHFVNIKIDMEKGEGIELAKRYGVRAYPTFLILDGDGKEMGRVVGGGELDKFIERVETAKDPSNSPDALKAVYNANKNLTTALAYMDALSSAYKEDEIRSFINTSFNDFNNNDKYSEKLWKYAAPAMAADKSPILPYVVDNKMTYNMTIGKDKVNNALISAYKETLLYYISGKREMTKEQVEKTCSELALLVDKDEVARYYMIIAKHSADNEIDKLVRLFRPNAFSYNVTETEKMQIERAFESVKGMPKEKIVEYYQNKAKMYRSMADSFDKQAEQSGKIKE